MAKQIFKFSIILSFGLLIYQFPPVKPSQVNIKPFSSITHILGTDQAGRDILQVSLQTIYLAIFISMTSSLIITKAINVMHMIDLKYFEKENFLVILFFQIFNLLPIIFIFLILSTILKLNIWLVIIFLTIFGWPLSYKIMENIYTQIKNDPATQFLNNGNIVKKQLFWQKYYYDRINLQQINAFQITFVYLIGVETSLSFLGYGLDPNSYYSFGMFIRDNYATILTDNSYQVLIPSAMLVIVTLVFFNYLDQFKKVKH